MRCRDQKLDAELEVFLRKALSSEKYSCPRDDIATTLLEQGKICELLKRVAVVCGGNITLGIVAILSLYFCCPRSEAERFLKMLFMDVRAFSFITHYYPSQVKDFVKMVAYGDLKRKTVEDAKRMLLRVLREENSP